MKSKIKIIVVTLTLGLAAYAAYADNVTISTYYPSPYGSYQTLETNILQGAAGAGNVALVPSAGNVGIGTGVAVPNAKLQVAGTGAGTIDLRVNGRIATGDGGNQGGVWLDGAGTMFVGQNGSNVGFWTSGAGVGWNAFQVTNAGSVGIGTASPAAGAKLDVVGRIKLQDSTGQSGLLAVSCDGTNCYPVYA